MSLLEVQHHMTCGGVQGMNFIAGCLLLFMDEEDTFWCLAIIVEELLPGYYSMAMVEPQVCLHKLPSNIPPSCHPAQNKSPEPGRNTFFCRSPQPTVMHHQEGLELKLECWLYHIHATCRTPARYVCLSRLLRCAMMQRMIGTLKQCPRLNIVMMATLHIALAIQASRSPLELALIVGFVNV